jgi:hypothetical protein
VDDGMNGGVGDRIAGMEEGETTGVISAKGTFIPPQAARKKRIVKTRIVLIMIASGNLIVSEIRKRTILFSLKMHKNNIGLIGGLCLPIDPIHPIVNAIPRILAIFTLGDLFLVLYL